MDAQVDTPDARAARIAARQHGVVTRRQLEAAGLGSKAITIRVRKGQLLRVHRGVYSMSPSLNLHSRFMAAVLACGEGAVLSHGSAAVLWKLLKPLDGPVHVSVPTTSGHKSQRGIHLHRCPSLAEPSSYLQSGGGRGRRLMITKRHNIPVTTIQRTVDDLDGTVAPYLVRRARRQAELMGIRLKGAEGKRLRSDLEEEFLRLVRHLPPPETNVKIGRWEVDCLWREHKLVVEIDSFLYHRGSVAFHEDHARDLGLRRRGYTVLHFTEKQLESEPEYVVADVARALGRRGPAAPN